jgi:chemotaxis receptor (MCP) glutamine deamidase CheD
MVPVSQGVVVWVPAVMENVVVVAEVEVTCQPQTMIRWLVTAEIRTVFADRPEKVAALLHKI